jgi:hypothetical protein
MSPLLLAAFAAIPFLRGRSAAVRHWVLAASLICAAAVPVLGPLVPSWDVRLASSASSWHQPRDQRMIGISLTFEPGSPAQGSAISATRIPARSPFPVDVSFLRWR